MLDTEPSALTALSPLDGRYAAKVAALRPLLSEFGLMHRRVEVEVEWFIALSDAGLPEFAPLGAAARDHLQRAGARLLAGRCAGHQGHRAHHQPRRQGGRVLAQGLLRARRRARRRAARRRRIRPLRLHQRGHQQHQPRADAEGGARRGAAARARPGRSPRCSAMAHEHADVPMLARTHGQTASPTTVGKEARQRRRPPGHGARSASPRSPARQDERRRRQLQRAPRGVSARSTGRRSARGGRRAAART